MGSSGHSARVSQFAMANRSYVRALECHDRTRLPVERNKLHLEGAASIVNVDHRTNVARRQSCSWNVACEYDAVVFLYSIHSAKADMP
jgi:hypothetical protein